MIIVTDELLAKVDPRNKKLQEQFLKIKGTTSSEITIKNYSSDLDIFFCWNVLENDNKFFVDIRKLDFSNFFVFATETLQWKSARFGRERATLSSFSNFIEKYYDEDYPKFRNVILKTVEPMPKNATRKKTVLSEEQVKLLKDTLIAQERWQDLCLLSLAIGSGARINELLRFQTTDIDPDNTAFGGLFIKTVNTIKTKGRTKEGKQIHKFILRDEFLPHYLKWCQHRSEVMAQNGETHNYIFIDSKGRQATEGVARGWAKDWGDIVGEPLYFHAFRHFTVTHLSNIGLEPDLITSIIGWADSTMLKVYDDTNAEDRNWEGLDKLKDYVDKNK